MSQNMEVSGKDNIKRNSQCNLEESGCFRTQRKWVLKFNSRLDLTHDLSQLSPFLPVIVLYNCD